MEYIRCHQKVRPIRFAFVVSPSDQDSILNAVKYSTALWGGLGNIILPNWKKYPNKEAKRRCLGLLKDFDPDYIINLTSFSLPKDVSSVYGKRVLLKSEFIKKNDDGSFKFGIGLSILPLLNHVWDKETSSLSGKSRCVRFKDIKGRYSKYWSVVYGDYPDNAGFDLGSHFSSALKARELQARFVNIENIKIGEIITPIDFTTYGLSRLGFGGGFSSHLVYMGNATNVLDLIEFWNIRASGRETVFVPTTHYKKFVKHITSVIKAGDYPINENVQNHTDLQKGPSVSDSKFEEICNWIKDDLKLNPPRRSWLPNWGRKSRHVVEDIIPREYIDVEKTTNLFFDGEDLSPLELARPAFFTDDKSYQEFRRFYQNRIYWVNQINLSDNYKNDYFFDLPDDHSLSDLVSYSFIFAARDKARLGQEGVIYYNDALMGEVNLHPLKTDEVINKMFKQRGMELSPSPAGVVGNRSPDSMGGPNWDNPAYKDLVLYYEQPRPLSPETVIDHLFKKNIFRAGIRFVCQNCGKEDWYHLTEFDVNFTCRYCFKNQHVGSLEGRSKKEWHYKSDGLFMIPDAGEGSLSVILALWRLDHLVHGNSFRYITSQNIKGVKDGEIDFITVLTNHFQMGSVLVLGEARNFVDFSRKDVSKLIKIGSKFEVKPYLCFATLKDKFSDNEKAII